MMGHQTLITHCKIDCSNVFITSKEKCNLCLAMCHFGCGSLLVLITPVISKC